MGKLIFVGDIREFAFALDFFLLVGVYGQWEESAACVGYEFASMYGSYPVRRKQCYSFFLVK
jgi:hypothetical protein